MLSIWTRLKFCHLLKAFIHCTVCQPFPKQQVLRLFQTERLCRGQFQLDENGRKFCKQVENTVGKEENARYEQFLLFPQCFQKTYTADM